jgi:hypothetical protein
LAYERFKFEQGIDQIELQEFVTWLARIVCQRDVSLHYRSSYRILIPIGCVKKTYSTYIRVITSRKMRWAGHMARMGEGRGVYRVLVGRPEGKRPLGRHTRRWEDNVKKDFREIGIGGVTGFGWLRIGSSGGLL